MDRPSKVTEDVSNPRIRCHGTHRTPYAVWSSPDFRLYAIGWFLMTFGKLAENVVVGVHLYALTRQPLSLGWVGLVQALPVILLAIAGGQIADRFDRRHVLRLMLGLTALSSMALCAAAHWGLSVGWFYLLLGIGAIGQALGSPSRAALLAQLVRPEVFSNAVTWNSSVFQIASMTGPAIGGLIVGDALHTPAAFGLVGLCRLLALAAIWNIQGRPQERSTETVSWQSVAAGLRFVWKTKLILATITLDLFAVLLGGATYLLPVFCEDLLGVGPRGVGLLRSAEAVGAVAMAVLLAHAPPMRQAGRTLLWAVAGFGAATIVFGLSRSFWLSMAMMFLIGALDNISVVVRHTLVQMLTPDAMRGRVSAVNGVFIVASNDLGGLESGLTAWLFGPVISVVGGGVGTILVVLAAARIWPQILSIGSLQEIRPAEIALATGKAEPELAARL
ncbi:MAG: MFS transporter [Thermoguttaceae bacterium]